MRKKTSTIICISIPKSLKKEANELVQSGHFSSMSELFRRSFESYKKEKLSYEIRQIKATKKRARGADRNGRIHPSLRKLI